MYYLYSCNVVVFIHSGFDCCQSNKLFGRFSVVFFSTISRMKSARILKCKDCGITSMRLICPYCITTNTLNCILAQHKVALPIASHEWKVKKKSIERLLKFRGYLNNISAKYISQDDLSDFNRNVLQNYCIIFIVDGCTVRRYYIDYNQHPIDFYFNMTFALEQKKNNIFSTKHV